MNMSVIDIVAARDAYDGCVVACISVMTHIAHVVASLCTECTHVDVSATHTVVDKVCGGSECASAALVSGTNRGSGGRGCQL